uniref:Uncharacterized protein n=1 Tax=Glossina pallidipes TaxID=7398 RepID=A0A1B0AEG8_GLOPL
MSQMSEKLEDAILLKFMNNNVEVLRSSLLIFQNGFLPLSKYLRFHNVFLNVKISILTRDALVFYFSRYRVLFYQYGLRVDVLTVKLAALALPNSAMGDLDQYLSRDLGLRKDGDSIETFSPPRVSYVEVVKSLTITTAASYGESGASTVLPSLDASIVAPLAETDGSHDADDVFVPVVGANE